MTQLNPAGRRMPCTCPKHCCRCPRRAVFLYGSACRFVPLVRTGRAAPCLVVGGYSSQTAQPTQEEGEEPPQQRMKRPARKCTVHISFCCWTLASGHQAMLCIRSSAGHALFSGAVRCDHHYGTAACAHGSSAAASLILNLTCMTCSTVAGVLY